MKRILGKKLLIVEGTHEVKFFNKFIDFMGLTGIQIENVGGNDFVPVLEGLKGLSGFSELQTLAILRDADVSYDAMFSSVQNTLKKFSYPVPNHPNTLATLAGQPNTIIYIFPDNKSEGSLENLLWSSVYNDPSAKCVVNYFDCLNNLNEKYGQKHPHLYKAHVQVFLAREEEGDIHMGIASEKNIWDFNNQTFDPIKEFLVKL